MSTDSYLDSKPINKSLFWDNQIEMCSYKLQNEHFHSECERHLVPFPTKRASSHLDWLRGERPKLLPLLHQESVSTLHTADLNPLQSVQRDSESQHVHFFETDTRDSNNKNKQINVTHYYNSALTLPQHQSGLWEDRLTFSRLLSKETNSNLHIHTLMAVAAMQDAKQHIRSSLGFSIFPQTGESFLLIRLTLALSHISWVRINLAMSAKTCEFVRGCTEMFPVLMFNAGQPAWSNDLSTCNQISPRSEGRWEVLFTLMTYFHLFGPSASNCQNELCVTDVWRRGFRASESSRTALT